MNNMNPSIRTFSSHTLYKKSVMNKKEIVIFIDLFFSTTSLVTSFAKGIKRAYLASDSESFISLCETHTKNCIYATEEGLKICIADDPRVEGFSFSKSTPIALSKKISDFENLVLWSSNGTPGIISSGKNLHTIISAMSNFTATTNFITQNFQNEDIAIVCAGSKNNASIEDLWCAGAYINSLKAHLDSKNFMMDMTSTMSLKLFLETNPEQLIRNSITAQFMISRDQFNEVLFSIKKDTSDSILIFDGINSITSI